MFRDRIIKSVQRNCVKLLAALDCSASLCIQVQYIEVKTMLGSHLYSITRLLEASLSRLSDMGHEVTIHQLRTKSRELCEGLFSDDIQYANHALNKLVAFYTNASAFSYDVDDKVLLILDEPTTQLLSNTAQLFSELAEQINNRIQYLLELDANDSNFLPIPIWKQLPDKPARDDRFEKAPLIVTLSPEDTEFVTRFHRTLMSLEIPTIEAVAQNIIESGDLTCDFLVDMSKQAWDEARHADAFIKLLNEFNIRLGSFPISCDLWALTYKHPIHLRLAIHQRIGETIGMNSASWWSTNLLSKGLGRYADVYDIIFFDELTHVKQGNYWLKKILNNDKKAIDKAIRDAFSIRKNQQDSVIDGQKKYPLNKLAMKLAGYEDEEEMTFQG